MPRRTTLTYSSEDAPEVRRDELYVYYCKMSGKHALTTDCDLSKAPKRRTDGASVINTKENTVRMYTMDGGVKVIRRSNGDLERQYRYNLGKLPVAYRSEPEGQFLYIIPGALATYSLQDQGLGPKKAPVPPCILPLEGGTTQLSLEVEDRADRANVIKVSADHVRIQITHGISHENAAEELLEFMRTVLGVRLAQLSVLRGESTRHKLLLVKDVAPAAVFDKLQAFIEKAKA